MATFNIINTATPLTGGTSASTGQGQQWQLLVSGAWVNGDLYTVTLTDTTTGFQSQFGAGYATGIQPVQVVTFNGKIYALSGSQVNFSGVEQPTTWNDPNGAFNGFFSLLNYYSTPENLVAMAPYQGRLAFFSNWTIQIFITDPNPANWIQAQVLPNMGTIATNSVVSLGDLDVLFLSFTGIRSLRVRDESLYAFINDIGTPIDTLIQASLAAGSASSNAAAQAVQDPSSGRVWTYLNGLIYVLSYYPSSKITAWSTYTTSYVSTQSGTPTIAGATIQSFCIFQGQVYALATSTEGTVILQYGGSTGTSFDTTTAQWGITWIDLEEPTVLKKAVGIDGALNYGLTSPASWAIKAGMDPDGGEMETVYSGSKNTFEQGAVTFTSDGYHFRISGASSGTGPATVSSIIFNYENCDEK